MVSVTVTIKEETTTSAVTVDSASQERLADADEIEAVMVHVTRPSAQMYLRSLITNLRKEGTALQSTLATVGPEDSETPSPAPATERAASPPKEITPVTKPTVGSAARHESREDDITAFTYEESQREKVTAEVIGAANKKENTSASSAQLSEHEGLERQDKTGKQSSFIIDLSDVPAQPPIPKRGGHIREGASKYKGVHLLKANKKWIAHITIDGKLRYIGSYDDENEAAVDYARAVFKYRSEERVEKAQEQNSFILDLSDVPPQLAILREGHIKEGASKYVGVFFDKRKKKWRAQIAIDGTNRHIGYYYHEEEAANDYARAVFKYKSKEKQPKAPKQSSFLADLSDVPPQPPIPRTGGHMKDGGSQYKGVYFLKANKKWTAQITISGELRYIGIYDNEKEAAIDYARAVFKYRTEEKQAKTRKQRSFVIDLSDVPPQPPISKRAGHVKEGASKYIGVSFNKLMKKWTAQIFIDGKNRQIGTYGNDEEAAIDYARAVFKYKGEKELERARQPDSFIFDLSNVAPQPPIPREGHIKEGLSKYAGISFDKRRKKWVANIVIDGKQRHIGYYADEEEAAVDYARAVFNYRSEVTQDKTRERSSFIIDLSDIPPQPPILKEGHVKDGASKYAGVYFDKSRNKWMARIRIDGKKRHIGYYVNEEEAAVDYARAVVKYRTEKKAETGKTQNAPETAKRKRPPFAEDETKFDASKRLKNAEKDNCNHMQAIKLEEDCCW